MLREKPKKTTITNDRTMIEPRLSFFVKLTKEKSINNCMSKNDAAFVE